jgi:high affinity Mn2+ porin
LATKWHSIVQLSCSVVSAKVRFCNAWQASYWSARSNDLFGIAAANAAAGAAPSWTGLRRCHAGYRWGDGTFTSPAYTADLGAGPIDFPARSESYNLGGGIFGVHGGYNHLLNGSWLIGIEGDISFGRGSSSKSAAFDVFDSNNDSFLFRRTSTLKLTWQATLRGRLGYVSGPWLVYGTGGVAFIRAKWSDSSSITSICCTSLAVDPTVAAWSTGKTLTGGVIGVGVEYMFDPRWIGRLEYLYENFGGFDVLHGFGPQFGRVEIDDVHKLRVGISYKLSP